MIYPVDLQLHSTASDGTDSPADLVRLAAARGIRVIALTDHDSVLGIDAAIAAGHECGVHVLPALEFSTRSQRELDLLDINILALGQSCHDKFRPMAITPILYVENAAVPGLQTITCVYLDTSIRTNPDRIRPSSQHTTVDLAGKAAAGDGNKLAFPIGIGAGGGRFSHLDVHLNKMIEGRCCRIVEVTFWHGLVGSRDCSEREQ